MQIFLGKFCFLFHEVSHTIKNNTMLYMQWYSELTPLENIAREKDSEKKSHIKSFIIVIMRKSFINLT